MAHYLAPCIVAAALLAALPALAAPTAALRSLSAQADWLTGKGPDDAQHKYVDRFANGNAQTGGTYTGGLVAPATLYTMTGGISGAETLPGDYTVDGQPLGRFTFSRGLASAPVVLDLGGGVQVNNQSHFLRMNGPTRVTPTGPTPDTLFRSNRSNFAASAGWDFSVPDVNMRYGMRLTDANIGLDGFDDLISLDVVRSADGSPALQLRRIAGSETTGARTISQVETRTFASGLVSGATLADVNLVAMHMYWSRDTNLVSADVELLRIANAGASINLLGTVTFAETYAIFNGTDGFTRLQVGAQWNDPIPAVPEPGTWALMAAGLLAVARVARRRG